MSTAPLDSRLSLFLMLGQTAQNLLEHHPATVSNDRLLISDTFDLALLLPDEVKRASRAAAGYRLFFVFENFLRGFVLDALSEDNGEKWWSKVPGGVQQQIEELEKKEETKTWMSVGSRDKISLATFPQLLAIIDGRWKEEFEPLLRDKSLVHSARSIVHLRNTVCHMTEIPDEEIERVKQVMRDWFRMVSP